MTADEACEMGRYDTGEAYIRATFQPQRTDDLKPDIPPIGTRTVWKLFGEMETGPYAGMLQWLHPSGYPWMPSCDLVDCEPASYEEWWELVRAERLALEARA